MAPRGAQAQAKRAEDIANVVFEQSFYATHSKQKDFPPVQVLGKNAKSFHESYRLIQTGRTRGGNQFTTLAVKLILLLFKNTWERVQKDETYEKTSRLLIVGEAILEVIKHIDHNLEQRGTESGTKQFDKIRGDPVWHPYYLVMEDMPIENYRKIAATHALLAYFRPDSSRKLRIEQSPSRCPQEG
ncbi:hypothetical protein B0A50_04808, partial [Salinomyces thailandicus]